MENEAGISPAPITDTRIKFALKAFENALGERSISAMPVVVEYIARIVRVDVRKKGEERIFRITRARADNQPDEEWNDVPRDAYALRDEFLKINSPGEALEFLAATGDFSPLHYEIGWSEFQLWQRFAYLVQEHEQLAVMMQSKEWTGELGEVLKALTGIYPSSFFNLPREPETSLEKRWREDPKFFAAIKEGERFDDQIKKELCSWFRKPSNKATSIEWIPEDDAITEDLLQKLQRGGSMMEFLLPRAKLRPVFLIQARYTLQAIAAAIYGDRANGVEYRQCCGCFSLFKLGSHKDKRYCDRARCKNRAHQKNRRANAKKQSDESTKADVTRKERAK